MLRQPPQHVPGGRRKPLLTLESQDQIVFSAKQIALLLHSRVFECLDPLYPGPSRSSCRAPAESSRSAGESKASRKLQGESGATGPSEWHCRQFRRHGHHRRTTRKKKARRCDVYAASTSIFWGILTVTRYEPIVENILFGVVFCWKKVLQSAKELGHLWVSDM